MAKILVKDEIDNPLILRLHLDDTNTVELASIFHLYYEALWDTILNLSVQCLLTGSVARAYQTASVYLREQHSDIIRGKLIKSAAYRASIEYYQIVKHISHDNPRKDKLKSSSIRQQAAYYRSRVVKLKPDDFSKTALFQYIPFNVTEPTEIRTRLPFRCNLARRCITPLNNYELYSDDLTIDNLLRHAETLPPDAVPYIFALCATRDKKSGTHQYDCRLIFRHDPTHSEEFARKYPATIKILKMNSMHRERRNKS